MCKLPLSVEVWGYTNEVRLRGLIFIACSRQALFVDARFQPPGIFACIGMLPSFLPYFVNTFILHPFDFILI
jgi:hypothetical protein